MINVMVQLPGVEVKPQYPYIGEYKSEDHPNPYSYMVLFRDEEQGMVIQASANSPFVVGHYSNIWNETQFTKFKGKVILENV